MYQDDDAALAGLTGGQQLTGATSGNQPLPDGTLAMGADNCLYVAQSGYWVSRGVCAIIDAATGYLYSYIQGQAPSSWYAALDTDPATTGNGAYTVLFFRPAGIWLRFPAGAAAPTEVDVDDNGQWVDITTYDQGLQQQITAEQQQIADQANTVTVTSAPFTIEAQGGTTAEGIAAAIAIQENTNAASIYEAEGDLGNSPCTVIEHDDGEC